MKLRRKIGFSIVLLVFGIMVLIVLFEVVINHLLAPDPLEVRLGIKYSGLWRNKLPEIRPDTDILIACAGDSHTEGAGAPLGFDYPSQLELQLNANYPESNYQVINLGVSGYNSSQATDRAIDYLKTSFKSPDFLIFCAGENNIWNLEGASCLPEEIKNASDHARWEYFIAHYHSYKLTTITAERIKTLWRAGNDQPLSLVNEDEIQFLTKWIIYDLNRLYETCQSTKTKLILLNYWKNHSSRIFINTFEQFSAQHNLMMIDVSNLNLPTKKPLSAQSRWISADYHPNQYGYARIVLLIINQLKDLLHPQ